MVNERGIILGPDVKVDVASNYLSFGPVNGGLLRHALLYWDKIDFPYTKFRTVSNDIDFLEQVGVAKSTHVNVGAVSGEMAKVYLDTQYAAFHYLTSQNPDMWSIGQNFKELHGQGTQVTRAQIAEIEINGVLPTPPNDVSLEDILEVKKRRSDEFCALRIAVDELYDEVLKSGSIPRAESAAVNRLQNVIKDIRTFVDQSWIDRLLSSAKFEFSIPKIVAGALTGTTTLSAILPNSEPVGAAFGAVSSTIKFEVKTGSAINNLPETTKNFAYLYYVEKELGHT